MLADSLLWRLKHPSSGAFHFLYGTMHVKNKAAFAHIERVEPLLSRSALYVGEMDLADPQLAELNDHFRLGSHQTLVDLYGRHRYSRMQTIIAKAYDVDIDLYIDLKPMILANILSEKTLVQHYDVALDQHLWHMAEEYDIETAGLESAQDQINILNNTSILEQKKMLNATFKNVNRYKKRLLALSKMYEDERLKDLFKVSKNSLGALRKPLLYDRNNRMADRVVELCQGEQVFITVGAAHLAGKYGLLRLLKKSGFKISAC